MVELCILLVAGDQHNHAAAEAVRKTLKERYGEKIAFCWHTPRAPGELREAICIDQCGHPRMIVCSGNAALILRELDCCELSGTGIIIITNEPVLESDPSSWRSVASPDKIPEVVVEVLGAILGF